MKIEETTATYNDWDRRGLPGWAYHNAALLKLETTEVFQTHWQIVGHVNDVPDTGDYITFDIGHERALVIRGDDGVVRGFHNLCRHRGSRVAVGDSGHCKNAIVCPFHGWVYNLDGTLRGAARPNSYVGLDRSQFGLRPVETEIWLGFIFIRFRPGPQGSMADYMQPFAAEIASYHPEDMVPAGKIWKSTLPVNWKSVRDVDNEGYHVPMAHPGLQDLYGASYRDTLLDNGLNCAKGTFNAHAGRTWSVRNYVKLSGGPDWLPEERRRVWAYYGLFPNGVIITTPETVQFYQELPVGTESSVIRAMTYRRAHEPREQRLARYLAFRIDRDTYQEDTQLSIWSNESMKSSAFENFHLSDLERGVRAHHDHMRSLLPVLNLDRAPPDHEMAEVNAAMKKKTSVN